MKTERELFEKSEFVKTIIHRYEWDDWLQSYQIKECVINGNVFDLIEAENDQPILNGAWFGWQASTQRDGFKLVPVELPDDTSDNVWGDLNCKSVFNEDCDGFIPHEDIDLGQIYKAMIGACDD